MQKKLWSRPSTAIEEGVLIIDIYTHALELCRKDEESSNISMLLSELGVKAALRGSRSLH